MYIKDFGVELWLNKYENHCRYNLSETMPFSLTVSELAELSGLGGRLMDEIAGLKLDYGDITGSPRLKEAISRLYSNVNHNMITVAHGTIGANSLVLMNLIKPGDRVIAVTPTYQQLYSLPESLGAEICLLKLEEEKGWKLDLDELRKAAIPGTKLICLNSPNNPTGSSFSTEEMKEIIEIAEKCGAYLFCDEAYRGLSLEGDYFKPSFIDLSDRAIVTGGLSKTFALAGLRMGWIAGPEEIIEDINIHRDYHIISSGKLDDLLSAVAMENRDKILKRNTDMCRENLEIISRWTENEPLFSFVKPEAATTLFMKYDFDMPSETFCSRLREEAGVLFVPGSAFDMEGHFRLGYGEKPEVIKAGLKAVSAWLRNNNIR